MGVVGFNAEQPSLLIDNLSDSISEAEMFTDKVMD